MGQESSQGKRDAVVVHVGGKASLMVNTLSTVDARKLIVCKLNYVRVSIGKILCQPILFCVPVCSALHRSIGDVSMCFVFFSKLQTKR